MNCTNGIFVIKIESSIDKQISIKPLKVAIIPALVSLIYCALLWRTMLKYELVVLIVCAKLMFPL